MNHYMIFAKQYPCDEFNYTNMLRLETDEILSVAKRERRQLKYPEAEAEAADRILKWAATANEYVLTDLPRFVAGHRPACVWAVLTAQALTTAYTFESGDIYHHERGRVIRADRENPQTGPWERDDILRYVTRLLNMTTSGKIPARTPDQVVTDAVARATRE